jgi:hypothetical protein
MPSRRASHFATGHVGRRPDVTQGRLGAASRCCATSVPNLTNANRNGGRRRLGRGAISTQSRLQPRRSESRSQRTRSSARSLALPTPCPIQTRTSRRRTNSRSPSSASLPATGACRATGVFAYNFDLRRLAEPLRPRSAYSIAVTNPIPASTACAGQRRRSRPHDHLLRVPGWLERRRIRGHDVRETPHGKQTYKNHRGRRHAPSVQPNGLPAPRTAPRRPTVPFDDGQADNPNSEIFTANQTWELTGQGSPGDTTPRSASTCRAAYEFRNGAPQARSGAIRRRPDHYADRSERRADWQHRSSRTCTS